MEWQVPGMVGIAIFNSQNTAHWKVTFEQRFGERVSQLVIRNKHIPAMGKGQYKGPKVETRLAHWSKNKGD